MLIYLPYRREQKADFPPRNATAAVAASTTSFSAVTYRGLFLEISVIETS